MVILDEPPMRVGAPPVQHRKEHPADDRSDEGDLGEGGERDLAVHGQRVSCSPQHSRPGSGGCGGQDPDRGGGPRNRAGQPGTGVVASVAEEAVTVDTGWFLSLRRCSLHRSPCPRTTSDKSTSNSRFLIGSTRARVDRSVRSLQ